MQSDLSSLPKHWNFNEPDPAIVDQVAQALGIRRLLAQILVGRGFTDVAGIKHFLEPSLDDLHDPFLLPDINPAVDAILKAHADKELVFVHGDYDADGVTSSAIFEKFLRSLGCNVTTHLPHRIREGYGIHPDTVRRAADEGAKLLLTCDCGISAHDPVALARELGMVVVVTDHHHVPDTLPDASAVINPHRPDSDYPFPELSGAGVAFKVGAAVVSRLGKNVRKYYEHFIDLAAIGTIADVMPLVGENRAIAALGIQRMNDQRIPGVEAIMRAGRLREPISSYSIGFQIGPRINAAGRIDDATLALSVLRSKTLEEAEPLAAKLEQLNSDRRSRQEDVVDEALQLIEEHNMADHRVIFLIGEGWHKGLVGIVAGRLVDRFRRPVFVGTVNPEKGVATGSARTIPGFHLANAINALNPLLRGGGHADAAGFEVEIGQIDEVRAQLLTYAESILSTEDLVKPLQLDGIADPKMIDIDAVEELEMLEPTGSSNPSPLLLVRHARLVGREVFGQEGTHVKATWETPEGFLTTKAFGIADSFPDPSPAIPRNLVVRLGVNRWNGRKEVQWTYVTSEIE
ncbi:MAG: single-stranded-DNA-specific exonuclease RecJ [Armatimonadetes bacterium]|nr:single-stranded-DNA-specific exonuclease RecJ [Armatimonadota bacterium]